jgi:carbon storage regulator
MGYRDGQNRGMLRVVGPTVRRKDWRSKMLVITRREGEEVVIGDPRNPIGVVRIASIKGDRVRVAFDFPRQIDVHRREVADQIVAGGAATVNGHVVNGHAVAGEITPNGATAE